MLQTNELELYKKAFDLAVDAFFEAGIIHNDICARYCAYARERNMDSCQGCEENFCGEHIEQYFMRLARTN